jgi:hypothetical protein
MDPISEHDCTNLMRLSERVANFASYSNNFPGSLFRLIISLAFLISLVGQGTPLPISVV